MRGESFGVRSFLPPASFNVMYLLRLQEDKLHVLERKEIRFVWFKKSFVLC